jgi:hypothetical protein
MSLTMEGIEAEKMARPILIEMGYSLQQLDWIGKKDGQWTVFEVKHRELFNPPPFLGTGLDKRQLGLRTELSNDLGLRTYLLVFIKNSQDVYGQFLDVLEQGEWFDTKNSIRIYKIDNFEHLKTQ